jgi:hypothetical protein
MLTTRGDATAREDLVMARSSSEMMKQAVILPPAETVGRRNFPGSKQTADQASAHFRSGRCCVSGRIHFELVKSTIVRPFLGTPAKKVCAMTKAATGKVIVPDFGNQVWFQRRLNPPQES